MTPDPPPSLAPPHRGDPLRVRCVAGPDAGSSAILPAGRHLVGRAPACAVHIADPALPAYAAVVTVSGDDPLPGAHGWWRVGDSLLRVEDAEPAHLGADATRREPGVVVRQPRRRPPAPELPPTPPAMPAPPDQASSTAGLLPSVLGIGVAVVAGVVTGQAVFVVMGVLGSLVGAATWAAGWWGDRRRRRRHRDLQRRRTADDDAALARARAAVAAHHLAVTSDLTTALASLQHDPSTLWERRGHHDDAFAVAIGTTTLAWPDELRRTGALDGYTGFAVASLSPGQVLAVRGPADRAAAVARSLVVQLLCSHGPADLCVATVTVHPGRWSWLAAVPHHGELADDTDDRHLVVVTDVDGVLADPTHPVRRLLASGRRVAVIAVVGHDRPTPQACTSEVVVDDRWQARWTADTALGGLPALVHAAGLDRQRCDAAATRLAGFIDPEARAASRGPRRDLGLGDLIDVGSAAAIAMRWDTSLDTTSAPTAGLTATVGVGDDDHPVALDLVADGPHALVAGTTGSGKSELLRTWVAAMALAHPPEVVSFVLVDFKGGAAFDDLATLPHVAGVVTDLDGDGIERCLAGLRRELVRREHVVRDAGVPDVARLPRGRATTPPRLVVVIDEFATLAHDHPERLAALLDIGRRGRSLGLHLVLATQRPAGVVTDDLRANTGLRIALRVHDRADAHDVVGCAEPAAFPVAAPGRAAVRRDGAVEVLQIARTGDTADLVAAIGEAARSTTRQVADPLWGPPLPTASDWRPGRPVGVMDHPADRVHRPLDAPRDGHLLVVAPTATSSLAVDTLVREARSRGDEVYVLGPYPGLRHCGAEVVPPDDGERRRRLVHRMDAATGATSAGRVLVVGPLHALRHQLGDDLHDEMAALAHLLRGDPHLTRLVVVAEQVSDIPTVWLGRFAQRWVGRPADPLEAVALGVPAAHVPAAVVGRVAVVTASGEPVPAQIGRWTGELHVIDVTTPPTPPVEVLPARVEADLVESVPGAVTLGLEATHLAPATTRLEAGTTMVVLGPPRSGRSTTLARLMHEWHRLHPDGASVALAPRRTALTGATVVRTVDELVEWVVTVGTAHALVVVDDADLVDDPRLADLARGDGPAVVAAATADGLRHAYGPWATALRRARHGMLAAAADRLDGDLLGATIPRVPTVEPRPGLMWSVEDGVVRLVQVALPAAPAVVARQRTPRR